MQRRDVPVSPTWRTLVVPLVQWLGLTAVLVAVSLLAVNGSRPPRVLAEPPGGALAEAHNSPFSLASLHQRLPPKALDRVQAYIRDFQQRRRRVLADSLGRSTKYIEVYKEIFRQSGLPEELAYLPIIESGFNPRAVSPAQAVGVWQFTEETGRRFNLVRNHWYDLRRDPMGSARAAAAYLKHLHATFNNWELALAAYNSGAGTVSWALRVNRRAHQPEQYWALDLPEETRNYVPAFLAAVLIAKNPQAFGFHQIRFAPQVAYDRIKVTPGLGLSRIAETLGVQNDDLLDLNPELVRGAVPPGDVPYDLRIPVGMRNMLPSKLLGSPVRLRDWVLHLVEDADTLQELSDRFRALPASIRKVNRIQSNDDLSRKQLLIIPL